nr:MAG TPA: minor capsid protein [Bacteriophage sp.]
MLTDREIEAAYTRMRDRIDLVNAEYLKAVARQINAIGGLNASSIRKLAQMRIYRANVVKIKAALAKALNLSVQELQELLERAAREVYADADYMAVIRGRRLMQLEYNEPLKKYISAVSAQTEERFHNYSNTTCIDENYQEAVTNAIDAVARGVTDYRSAIRDTMRKLGGDGLRITYESGVTRRMDTALRQNVLDGVKQIQQEAQRLIGEEIGATGVELSAHPFSAVDHEPAQGRQFSLQEFSRMQAGQPFTDANGNRYDGFKRPIGEWNCRHFASYIILGVSPRRYTDAQLKAWKEANHKGCTIGGKHYTVYEASQLMRQLETSVRRQKDIANLAKLSGDDKLRREAQAKIVTLKAQYKAVSEASGLKQRAERMVVEGFGRKEAAEAEKGAEQHYQKWSKEIGVNSSIESLAKYYDVKYNDSPRYELLKGYAKAVKKGDISPLVGFDRYEEVGAEIQKRIVGTTTSTGITIESFTNHFIDRIIGQTSTPHPGMRCGVSIEDALDALQNPKSVGVTRVLEDGDIRQTLAGAKADVTISIRDKRIIQTNPNGE